jgi:hypothetical protein
LVGDDIDDDDEEDGAYQPPKRLPAKRITRCGNGKSSDTAAPRPRLRKRRVTSQASPTMNAPAAVDARSPNATGMTPSTAIARPDNIVSLSPAMEQTSAFTGPFSPVVEQTSVFAEDSEDAMDTTHPSAGLHFDEAVYYCNESLYNDYEPQHSISDEDL